MLLDAHCHLTFSPDPAGLARALRSRVPSGNGGLAGCDSLPNGENLAAGEQDIRVLSCAVEPSEFDRARCLLSAFSWVRAGVGLHPWWVKSGDFTALDAQLDDFKAYFDDTVFVGEIGLDFAPFRAGTREEQLEAFGRIVRLSARAGERVLSLHCVRAYDELLDLLEDTDCAARNACVLHWFSGTSEQLQRAISLGCWFSVGERMLRTKRGRAYAMAMPLDRVLLETDLPEQGLDDASLNGEEASSQASALRSSLDAACKEVLSLWSQRCMDWKEALSQLEQNSSEIWKRL